MDETGWTFLTNHGHVLVCLARSPGIRLRDVAAEVGITERAVQRIVADLEAGGYLTRHKAGRQNEYEIDPRKSLRHPIEAHQTIGTLLALGEPRRTPPDRTKRSAPPARRRHRGAS